MTRFYLFATALALPWTGCGKKEQPAPEPPQESGFVSNSDLVEGEDGLTRVKGDPKPYTGPVVVRDKDWNVRYFANYFEGQLYGPEIRYHGDNSPIIDRWYDWESGEKTRHREIFENGQIKRDAMTRDGEAYGKHLTWDEAGMLRFDGNFTDNLQWDGHIKDVDAEGNVLWDAIFDNGRYISGVYPKSEEENLIKNGMLDPETLEPIAKPEAPVLE